MVLGSALVAVPATAQETLGAVLDAGAKRISAKDFETEIVQRIVVGPGPTGGELELMYTSKGTVEGSGRHPMFAYVNYAAVRGEWKLDEAGRACLSMLIASIPLPSRCQYWYKLGDKYYVSDSDVDRSAKVLSRTIKR
jgi:hypothetical protein